MFTTAFRRLQSKTQVFQAGEYDFYRTRLTHSLEVANIAKSIVAYLRTKSFEVAVDPDLVEAICLSHDIGHPPFGHAGERVLNELMRDYGGFEGNAQTLRILTRTIFSATSGRNGMSPTRALVDGVLKYKRLYQDRGEATKHFIYDDQAPILEFCFGTSNLAELLGEKAPNKFHSLECQIMDHADDVAYSCFDIIDGAKARFITTDRLRKWKDESGQDLDRDEQHQLDLLMKLLTDDRLEANMNHIIGELIQSASLQKTENFMTARTRRHSYSIVISPEAKSRIHLHKKLCQDLVFGSGALQQIEFKGGQILRQLTGVLFDNYLGVADKGGERKPRAEKVLLPTDVHRAVRTAETAAQKARLLCDHLSGMTDAYALRSYKRLFDPDYGSISELI